METTPWKIRLDVILRHVPLRKLRINRSKTATSAITTRVTTTRMTPWLMSARGQRSPPPSRRQKRREETIPNQRFQDALLERLLPGPVGSENHHVTNLARFPECVIVQNNGMKRPGVLATQNLKRDTMKGKRSHEDLVYFSGSCATRRSTSTQP